MGSMVFGWTSDNCMITNISEILHRSVANSPVQSACPSLKAFSHVFASALTNGGGPGSHSYLTNKGNQACVAEVLRKTCVDVMVGF